MTDARKALVFLCGIALIFVGLSVSSCHYKQKATADRAEADRLRAVNQGLEIAKEQAVADGKKLAADNVTKDEAIQKLLAKRLPAPPKPDPAPVTDPELASGLLSKGLSEGVAVQAGVSSVLIPADARKVWSWAEDAARVPAFELKSAADDILIQEQGKFTSGLKAEVSKCYEVTTLQQTQIGTIQAETASLRSENAALLKVQVAENAKWKIKIGVAATAAAYLGYRLAK